MDKLTKISRKSQNIRRTFFRHPPESRIRTHFVVTLFRKEKTDARQVPKRESPRSVPTFPDRRFPLPPRGPQPRMRKNGVRRAPTPLSRVYRNASPQPGNERNDAPPLSAGTETGKDRKPRNGTRSVPPQNRENGWRPKNRPPVSHPDGRMQTSVAPCG